MKPATTPWLMVAYKMTIDLGVTVLSFDGTGINTKQAFAGSIGSARHITVLLFRVFFSSTVVRWENTCYLRSSCSFENRHLLQGCADFCC